MAKLVCCLLVVIMTICMILLVLPYVIGTTIAPSNSSSINKERQALLQSGWWNDYQNISDHCTWNGIDCNKAGSVTRIYPMVLNIPPSEELRRIQNLNLTAFPNLPYLDLNGMSLTGSIPKEISTLTKLTYLYLSNNRLCGSIPVELGNLTQLKELYLSHNSLSGSIPSTLGHLVKLTHLYLDSNLIQDSIPVELGNLTQLLQLHLSHNLLTDVECKEFPLTLDIFVESLEEYDEEMRAQIEESMQQGVTMIPASNEAIQSLQAFTDSHFLKTEKCNICMDEFYAEEGDEDDAKLLSSSSVPCGHVFHRQCIVKWLQTSHTCPLCRYPMPSVQD